MPPADGNSLLLLFFFVYLFSVVILQHCVRVKRFFPVGGGLKLRRQRAGAVNFPTVSGAARPCGNGPYYRTVAAVATDAARVGVVRHFSRGVVTLRCMPTVHLVRYYVRRALRNIQT